MMQVKLFCHIRQGMHHNGPDADILRNPANTEYCIVQ